MASKSIARLLNPVFCSSRTISPSVLRPYPRLPRTSQPANRRFAHSIPKPPSPFSATGSKQSNQSEVESRKRLEPHYRLTFTCVPCGERSAHVISKQGYHKGSVLITCPTCRNRHIISDHLNIFGERKITIEDIMREKGQLVKRGTLGEDGDVEFWQDETVPGQGDDGAGDGATATSETTASQSAENEDNPEAGVEEEDATRLRETRDPSSHSTQPTGATASSLLGSSGARPKVDSTQQSNTTPSTRRPYSTKKRRYLSQPSSRRARRRKRMKYREWLHWVLRTKRYYWSHITKGPKPFSLRRTMVKVKIDDSHSVLLRPVGSFFQKLRYDPLLSSLVQRSKPLLVEDIRYPSIAEPTEIWNLLERLRAARSQGQLEEQIQKPFFTTITKMPVVKNPRSMLESRFSNKRPDPSDLEGNRAALTRVSYEEHLKNAERQRHLAKSKSKQPSSAAAAPNTPTPSPIDTDTIASLRDQLASLERASSSQQSPFHDRQHPIAILSPPTVRHVPARFRSVRLVSAKQPSPSPDSRVRVRRIRSRRQQFVLQQQRLLARQRQLRRERIRRMRAKTEEGLRLLLGQQDADADADPFQQLTAAAEADKGKGKGKGMGMGESADAGIADLWGDARLSLSLRKMIERSAAEQEEGPVRHSPFENRSHR